LNTGVRTFCIHGGVDQSPQIEALEKGIEILISTPGRMFDLISQGYLKTNNIKILILDEADHMLDLGFINDIRQLVKKLPHKRQTLFFSATINDKIKELAYSLVNKPVRIQISPKDPVSKNIEHSMAFIDMDDKRFFLERLINENPESKILVFVRTKIRAERVHKVLERCEIKSVCLHGDKEQFERTKAIKLFRVGRTGRGTKKGQAYSFCSPEEKDILLRIEIFLSKPIKVLSISKTNYSTTPELTKDTSSDWRSLIETSENKKPSPQKKRYKK